MAWSEGRRSLGAILRSSDGPIKLSQSPCGYDESIINIVLVLFLLILLLLYIRACLNHRTSKSITKTDVLISNSMSLLRVFLCRPCLPRHRGRGVHCKARLEMVSSFRSECQSKCEETTTTLQNTHRVTAQKRLKYT